ncbi:MAG: DUF3078 domain-containing protein [Flavobacteriaceae bacterium]|nr:DUF3078 domain-containing protein [Flavobacteriaceae bacterium]
MSAKNQLLINAVLFLFCAVGFSQTTQEELEAQRDAKKDSVAAIEKRIKAINSEIEALPGWKIGAFGVAGFSLSEFNNWYAQGTPNNQTGTINLVFNGFANLQEDKFFWKNSLNANLRWVKIDDKDIDTDDDSFSPTTDVFNLTSLYGRKLSENFAISTLAEFRTTIIDNFNDPGYLDIGVGATWTPTNNLTVVVHPINYNFVFSDEDDIFESSLGAKIVADYTRKIGDINFKSNLSAFQSYKSSDFSNWTWTNSFAWTLWKNIGVGFDFGLRQNKQEALDYSTNVLGNTDETFDSVDNELQSYYTIGLSYAF